MDVPTVGIDLPKNTFSLHGVDRNGNACLRKTVSRMQLIPPLAALPPCLVGMEACTGAHHWARKIRKLGHSVRIIAPKFVIPYRKGGKNDGNGAAAICDAVARSAMRFVPVKSAEQQAILWLDCVRQGLIRQRMGLVNQLRGLVAEFGLIFPKGRYQLHDQIPAMLEDAENALLDLARQLIHDLWLRYHQTHEQTLAADHQLASLARQSPAAKRVMTIPGAGELVSTALVAAIDPSQFARAVIANLRAKTDKLNCCLRALIARPGYKRAIFALAARNARLIWTLLRKQADYPPQRA